MRVYKHINGAKYHRKIVLVVDTRKHPAHTRTRPDIICIEIYEGFLCYIDCLRKMDIMHQTRCLNIKLPPYDIYDSTYDNTFNDVDYQQSCLPYYLIMDKYIEDETDSEDVALYANRFGGRIISNWAPIGYMIYRANSSFNYVYN
jgi:hypothetical protein